MGCLALQADEPAEAFLQALRDRGHYDLAEAYLEQMQTSPLVAESFRKTIPFERAVTIIQSTARLRDINQWEERLAEAERLLQQFSGQADTPATKAKALESLAELRFRQARVFLVRAENDRQTADERNKDLGRARDLMKESIAGFEQAREHLKGIIEQLTAAGDTSAEARRQLEPMRISFLQVRLRVPMVREQLADSFPADALERRDALQAALTEYLYLWENYYRYAAGVDAALYAARCRMKLGLSDEALGILEEMFQQRDTAALRPVKREAALIAIDCWRQKSPYPAAAVVERLEPLVADLSRAESSQAGWQRIQLELAYAYDRKGRQMQQQGQGTASDISAIKRRAITLARVIARSPGPHRDEARELLTSWNAPLTEEAESEAPIATFVAARDKLVEFVVDAEAIYREMASAGASIAADDPAASALQESVQRALSMAQTALRLATVETDRRDINHVRFLQAYCYYLLKRYYEVAVIAQFMVDKYSGVEYSRQAGGLLVDCFARLYEQADDEGRVFAKQRLTESALRVGELYPGSPEADNALAVLARLSIQDRDLEGALAYLRRMSPQGGGKLQVTLQLGQQLWLEYRASRSKLTDEEMESRRDELQADLTRAKTLLADSIAGINAADVTFDAALSALFLAAAQVESGELAAAVQQLEEAPLAPLDLIKQRHPAVFDSPRRDSFLRESYRTALNAYLANLRTGSNQQVWLTKSQAVLDALRQHLENQAGVDVNREMASIYGLLAVELRQQFAGLTQSAERENLAASLAQFLGNLERQATDARTLMWVGATLLETARALVGSGSEVVERGSTGDRLYRQAFEVLTRVEKIGFAGDPQQEARDLELQRAKAIALRGMGEYEQAVKVFAAVLEKKPAVVPIQLEAAHTLRQWAATTRNSKTYEMAMMGTEPRTDPNNARNRRNVIWGYRQLVTALRDQEKMRDQFFDAYYHLIESRLEYGILVPSTEAIRSAQAEINNLRARDETLGGAAWRPRLEKLERRIKEHMQ